MSDDFKGTLFSPGNSEGLAVRVTVKMSGITVKLPDTTVFEMPFHAVSASKGGYNNKMLVLAGERDGTKVSLYFEDKSIVDALSSFRLPPGLGTQLGKIGGSGSKPGRFLFWGGITAAVCAALYFAVVWGVGAAIDVAVQQIPIELEEELGKGAAQDSLSQHAVCTAPAVLEAVNQLSERLVGAIPNSPYTFRVKVIDVPDMNAFALPGGYLFINFGLLEEADSPEQVAGVLAHEIQHSLQRHGLRNVVARAGIFIVAALLIGDVQGFGGMVAGGASQIAAMSFSREQEEEADRKGVELLLAANIDPGGLPDFFLKVKAKEEELGLSLPSFMSTHPDTDARISTLKALIKSHGELKSVPFDLDWKEVQSNCVPASMGDPDKDVTPGIAPVPD